MDPRTSSLAFLVLSGALALASPTALGQAPVQDEPFLLEPDFVDRLAVHVPKERSHALVLYKAEHAFEAKGLTGRILANVEGELLSLESGLTGIRSRTTARTGTGIGSSRTVVLCGLVVALYESSSTVDTSGTVVVPIGNVFVPLGIKSSIDFSNRTKLVKFETDAASVCSPAAGARFTYRAETEATMKSSGLFGQTKTVRQTVTASCRVGDAPLAMSRLDPKLAGDYLQVSCDRENQEGKKGRYEYAFIRDAGYYLPLEQIEEAATARLTYSDLGYGSR